MTIPYPTDPRIESVVLRIYERYQLEIVEAFNLCPWAERARLDGRISRHVIVESQNPIPQSLTLIDLLEKQPEIEIGLFIFPTLRASRHEFEQITAELVEADRARRGLESAPFALAAFHPDAEPNTQHAERLIPFLRRSPDPTLQLVRISALDRVRAGSSEGTAFVDVTKLDFSKLPAKRPISLRERISRANLRTVERVGVHEVERILLDIGKDRAESYERVGLL